MKKGILWVAALWAGVSIEGLIFAFPESATYIIPCLMFGLMIWASITIYKDCKDD